MAWYIEKVDNLDNPFEKEKKAGIKVSIFMDSAADLGDLPKQPEVKETSTALDTNTGNLAVLMTAGWKWLP